MNRRRIRSVRGTLLDMDIPGKRWGMARWHGFRIRADSHEGGMATAPRAVGSKCGCRSVEGTAVRNRAGTS